MTNEAASESIRLQVALARAGVASRRAAAALVEAGRVTVNGAVAVEPGARVDPARDAIRVDGEPIAAERLRYFALHKPRNVLSAASDAHGRALVTDYLPPDAGRCVPVGRLDLDSEGLLLLTNDGPLIDALLHPRNALPREYVAEVEGRPTNADLARMEAGVELDDGIIGIAKPRRLQRPGSRPDTSWLSITLHQGRKREVRRLCEAVGHPVVRLIRVRFGPLRLRDLAPGALRELTPHEVRLLHRVGRPRQ